MKKLLIILMGVLLIYNEPVIAKNATSNIKIAKKVQKAKKKAKKVVKKKTKKKVVKKKTKKIKYNYRYNVGEIQSYAHNLVRQYGWSEADYQALVLLWYRESSWNPYAVNKKSGACGIPQANPCSKASKGTDYKTNWRTQIKWGLNYIKKRYGSPSEAWSHSQRIGWY